MTHPNSNKLGPNPDGLCMCGCGNPVPLARRTDSRFGNVKGQPVRFLTGHFRRNLDNYVAVDRGYDTPCWEWQGAKWPSGYGMIRFGSRRLLAHRVTYERMVGPIPDGLVLDHLCRNTSCVNPEHLDPVTVAVNNQRRRDTVITHDIADAIRVIGQFASQQSIADILGISQQTVSDIMRGRSWKTTETFSRPKR